MARETAIAGKGHQEADYLFRHLCRRLQELHGDVNLDILRKSFELALAAHEGQVRKDGSPYIMHPLEVAEICINLNLDEESIIAAILHDTVEDTPVRLSQIKQQFGDGVARMVDNLTKIKKIDFFARFTGRNKASMGCRLTARCLVTLSAPDNVKYSKRSRCPPQTPAGWEAHQPTGRWPASPPASPPAPACRPHRSA